jgi:hypothetical protein
MDLPELGAWLRQPDVHDVMRVETLDGYVSAGDEPHYTRWGQGLAVEVNDAWAAWLDQIAADRAAGKIRRRVHAMSEPLSRHNLFECGEQYTRNSAAGEDIRVLTATPAERAGMRDFWVLNHAEVAVMEYSDDGKFLHAWHPADPEPWVHLAWALWRASEPFATWWASRPQQQVA